MLGISRETLGISRVSSAIWSQPLQADWASLARACPSQLCCLTTLHTGLHPRSCPQVLQDAIRRARANAGRRQRP